MGLLPTISRVTRCGPKHHRGQQVSGFRLKRLWVRPGRRPPSWRSSRNHVDCSHPDRNSDSCVFSVPCVFPLLYEPIIMCRHPCGSRRYRCAVRVSMPEFGPEFGDTGSRTTERQRPPQNRKKKSKAKGQGEKFPSLPLGATVPERPLTGRVGFGPALPVAPSKGMRNMGEG